MVKEYITDFEFKDKRTYVHSTTFIDRFCRLIFSDTDLAQQWKTPRIDAMFHRKVTSNGRFRVYADRSPAEDDDPGQTELTVWDDEESVSAVFVEDPSMAVTRRIQTRYAIDGLQLEKDFSGAASICCRSFNNLVEHIVEVNKRLHLMTLGHRNRNLEIINLYIKKLPVLHPGIDGDEQMLLKIENIGVRHRKGSVVTLNALRFPGRSYDRFEVSFITFGL